MSLAALARITDDNVIVARQLLRVVGGDAARRKLVQRDISRQ